MVCLYDNLQITEMDSPRQLLQYLFVMSKIPSPKTVKFICVNMIPHPLSAIGQAAVTVVIDLIDGIIFNIFYLFVNNVHLLLLAGISINVEFANELLQDLRGYQER